MPRYTRPGDRDSLSLSDLRTLLQELEVAKKQLSDRLAIFNPTIADLEDPLAIGQLQMQLVNVGAAAAELKGLSLKAIQAFDDLKKERTSAMVYRRESNFGRSLLRSRRRQAAEDGSTPIYTVHVEVGGERYKSFERYKQAVQLAKQYGALDFIRGGVGELDLEGWIIDFPPDPKNGKEFVRALRKIIPRSFRVDHYLTNSYKYSSKPKPISDTTFWIMIGESHGDPDALSVIPPDKLESFHKKFWNYAYKISNLLQKTMYSSDLADDVGSGVVAAGKSVYQSALKRLSERDVDELFVQHLVDTYNGADYLDEIHNLLEEAGLL